MSFTMFECLDNLDTESICGEHREAQIVVLYWIDRWSNFIFSNLRVLSYRTHESGANSCLAEFISKDCDFVSWNDVTFSFHLT